MDLEKVLGKKVKRIEGYVTSEFGEDVLVFKLCELIFEDGTRASVEGEHDILYIPGEDYEAEFQAHHRADGG